VHFSPRPSPFGKTSRDAFALLDAEWALLDQHTTAVQTVVAWLVDAGVLEPELGPLALTGLRNVLADRDRRHGWAHSDRWLAVLLRRARGSGREAELAARFIVQAMLPSAVRTAQRLVGDSDERTDIAQGVVACLWQATVTFPLERRPVRIAANIALETVHLATREIRRERPGSEGREPNEELVDSAAGPAGIAEEKWLVQSASRLDPLRGDGQQSVDGQRRELLEVLVWAVDTKVVALEAARELVRLVEEQDRVGGLLRRPGVQETARVRKARSRTVQRLRAEAPRFLAHAA
jgi:hypothetical protein